MRSEPLSPPRQVQTLGEGPEAVRAVISATCWTAVIAVLLVVDYWRWTKNDKSTFSDTNRFVFRTNTLRGKLAFLGSLVLYARHILKPDKE